jgi:type VI secretion system protein ImpE
MQSLDYFNAGKLTEAIAAASSTLRSKPLETASRFLLAQLMCFQDDFEKADRQFEVFASQAPTPVPGVALCRQLVRAAKSRQEFFLHGRMPEFFSAPPVCIQELMRAWVHLRVGDPASAKECLQKSQETRPSCPGECNGVSMTDFLDLDDFLAPVIEVLTPTGKYFWISISDVRRISFKEVERPLDLIWRPATLDIVDGPSGDAYIPAVYWDANQQKTDAQRMGRETEWHEVVSEVFRGTGQKCFLVGDEDLPIMEISTISIHRAKDGEEIAGLQDRTE